MNRPTPILACAMLGEPGGQSALLLTQVRGRPLYDMVLETMARCHFARKILVTDLPQATALARKLGVKTSPPAREYAALGRSECELVAQALGPDEDAPVILLNWRWPLLSASTIEEALRSFQDSGRRILASAALTEDNPVQVNRGYRLLDTGPVVFLDSGEVLQSQWLKDFHAGEIQAGNKAPYLPTHPFFQDWTGLTQPSQPSEGGIAALCWLCYAPGQTYYFVPRDIQNGSSYYSQSVVLGLYRREGRHLARHLVSSYWLDSVYPRKMVGLDPFAGTASPGAICLRQEGSLLLCLPDQEPVSNAVLRAWPFRDGTIMADMAMEVTLGAADEQRQFLWNKVIHLTVRLPGDWSEAADGFLYSLMVPDNQDADFMEPLIFHEGPYRYDPGKRQLATTEGTPIAGRQHFAPIRTLNTALTILRGGDLHQAGKLRASEGAAVFELPEEQAYFAGNEFDLSRIG